MSTDWQAIRHDYESGLSLRTLAAKYNVKKSTIYDHVQAENWQKPDRTPAGQPDTKVPENRTPRPATEEAPLEADSEENPTATLARGMVKQLAAIVQRATIAEEPLDLREHKLFADSLSQYHKIIVTDASSTAGQPGQPSAQDERVLLALLNKEEWEEYERHQAGMQRLLDVARERQDSKVTPLRKVQ